MNMAKKTQHKKVQASFTVINRMGLHTRPSTELVRCASAFKAEVTLTYQKTTVNAKSLLGILMLAAVCGAKIHVKAEGIDAAKAVKSLLELAKDQFHIQY